MRSLHLHYLYSYHLSPWRPYSFLSCHHHHQCTTLYITSIQAPFIIFSSPPSVLLNLISNLSLSLNLKLAAFSTHHDPTFMVLDSGFVPNTSTKMMSGFLEQEMINNKTTCFSPLHNSGSCLTGNHYYTESSSSMVAVAVAELLRSGGVGGQPTQVVVTHLEQKRKAMGSKVDGEGKCQKEKKCSDDGMSKNGEEKNIKAERKNKKKKKAPQEPPIGGYVHVRARRGQATDSHSLAERVRREKISERMRLLQSLVPGCDKMTGKALILEEIINYVQCLQNQVQFLVMKLADVYPMFNYLDTNTPASENVGNLEPPMQSVTQSDSMELVTAPISTSFLHQQDQSSIFFTQDDGDHLLGDMGDQTQKLYGHNNLCSF